VDRERNFLIIETDELGMAQLRRAGFHLVLDEGQTRASKDLSTTGIPGYPCYPTFAETLSLVANLQVTWPELVSVVDIGDSWEKSQGLGGHDLVVLVLSNSNTPGPKPPFFANSGLHAREYSPGGLTVQLAQHLLENYGTDADITALLDDNEVHLLLAANPDGRVMAEQGLSWRKNTNNDFCSGSNSRGIDLNRNLEFQWGFTSSCSSGSQCSSTFRGPAPASEPEIDSLQSYLRAIFPDQRGSGLQDPAPEDAIGVFVDLHSYGRQVLWPYGFDTIPAPNDTALTTLGRKLAWFNGYSPEKASALFDTCGTTDDFAYGDLGVAAYTFEMGFSFFEPCQVFEDQVLQQNIAALLYAAKVARAPYLWPAGPNAENLRASASSLLPGQNLHLNATVSDDRFRVATVPPGSETVDTINGAATYVNQPSWEGGVPTAMTASDGSFDTSEEAVETTLDTSAWTIGKRLLRVQGNDSSGSTGAPGAVFVTVKDPAASLGLDGTVLEYGSINPLAARLEIAGETAFSLQDGSFALAVVPGTADITVSLAGYCDRVVKNVSGNAGELKHLPVITLIAEPAPVQQEVSWASPSSWILVEDGDSLAWTDSPDGDYADNQNNSLLSMPFTASGKLTLSFEHRYRLDAYSHDIASVSYQINEEPWQDLSRYYGDGGPSWLQQSFDLEVPNGSQLRFRFNLSSDAAFGHDGWWLKNMQLSLGNGCSLTNAISSWPETSILDIIPLL